MLSRRAVQAGADRSRRGTCRRRLTFSGVMRCRKNDPPELAMRCRSALAKMPTRCPVSRADSQALGCEVRQLLYGKRRGVYRILFSIVGDTVWVLRIRHGAHGRLKP